MISQCEFDSRRTDGRIHGAASQHVSGFVLCAPCGKFMDDLEAMVTANRRERASIPRYVAGKRL